MKYTLLTSECRTNKTFIATLLALVTLFAPLTPVAAQATRAAKLPAPQAGTPGGVKGGGVKSDPAAITPQAVTITATKQDSFPDPDGDGKVGPSQTITYTVQITNSGSTDATGVVFNDTIDPNTTLVGGSIMSTPLANSDTYNVIGNVRIQPNAAQGVLTNDSNPDNGNNTGMTASGPTTTTQGGNLTINSDGSFSYNPPAGFAGTDSFTYTATVTATGKTDTGTVTLNVGNGTSTPGTNVIWFVDANQASNGDGRLTSPFNCLRGPGCFDSTTTGGAADDPGDSIFLYSSANNYTGGSTLLNTEKLVGQGASASLATIAGVTVQAYSDALPTTGGANPTIISSGTSITLASGNLIRGLTFGNSTTADIVGTNYGTLTLGDSTTPDVTLNGTGKALDLNNGTLAATSATSSVTVTSSTTQGISLQATAGTVAFGSTTISSTTAQCVLVSGSTVSANFGNTSCTGGTDGISLQNNSSGTRTFGTLGISGNSAIGFRHFDPDGAGAMVGGGTTTITGATTISSAGNPIDIQDSGNVTINFQSSVSATRTASGGTGVNWSGTNTSGTLTFNSLTIQTNAGTGLNAAGGGTLNVTNNTGTINNTTQAAAAIVANNVTLNANFTTVNSSGGTNGISLTTVAGTSNFGSGALSGASGVEFLVSGGAGSVTYNGTITQTTAARVVDIQSKTGGTIAFGGAITSNNGTGQGIFLNSNTGATINFTGNLTLSTGANAAFTATGGGTVSSTNANSTVTSTTGIGVNIANTTIGGSGVTFKSVTVNGAANGILLNTTGAGAFTVTGDGASDPANTTRGRTTAKQGGGTIALGSGGTINNTTGAAISLNSATNVTLRNLSLTGNGGGVNSGADGINAQTVTTLTLDNVLITGHLGNDGLFGSGVSALTLQHVDIHTNAKTSGVEASDIWDVRLDNLTGTSSVANSLFFDAREDIFTISNSGSSNLNMTVTNSEFRDTDLGTSPAVGNTAFAMLANNTAVTTLTASGSLFKNARTTGFQYAGNNDSSGTITVKDNTSTPAGTSGFEGNGVDVDISHQGGTPSAGSTAVLNFEVSNNKTRQTLRTNSSNSININMGGNARSGASMIGTVKNNVIGNAAVANSGSDLGAGIAVDAKGAATTTISVTGNTVNQVKAFSGNVFDAGTSQTAKLNLRVRSNTFNGNPAQANPQYGLHINAGTGTPGETNLLCVDMGQNSVTMPASAIASVDLDSFPGTTTDLVGYTGAANNGTQIQNFFGSNPGTTPPGANTVTTPATLYTAAGGTTRPAVSPCSTFTFPTGPEVLPGNAIGSPQDSVTGEMPNGAAAQQTEQVAVIAGQPFVAQPQAAQAVSPAVQKSKVAAAQATAAQKDEAHAQTTSTLKGGDSKLNAPQVANFPVTIGTLAAGKTVTITFQVTVNSPLAANVTQVSNQGSVSGGNFSTVQTTDPGPPVVNGPTVTPVTPQPTINIKNASVARPQSGTTTMPFTVVLSSAYTIPVSVNFQTNDGTAIAGQDYTTTSGTVTFPAGVTVQTISVPVLANGAASGDRTFTVTLSSPVNGSIGTGTATGTITAANPAGTVLISELRTSGPGAGGTGDPNDDFVEVYNNSNSPLTVTVSDGSAGWAVVKSGATCTDQPVVIGVIPTSTVIPSRGHYLLVGTGYSLAGYAAGNLTMTTNIEDDKNVGLFNTSNVANFATGTRLDAVGFGLNTGGNCDLLREGSTLPAAQGSISQYSFVRKMTTGTPQDTNDNSADFTVISTDPGTAVGATAQPTLGGPGPESTTSPIQRNAQIKASLVDTQTTSTAVPNRQRLSCGDPGAPVCSPTTSANGFLFIRRKFTNTTGGNVTRLRFRIVDITTATAPPGQADLRALTSVDATVSTVCCGNVLVRGLTLEQPPNQPNGGGLNSTLAAGTITTIAPLSNGSSINVQFQLGVQQGGTFRFFINVEALP